MTFLPIVERELRVAARRKGTYWSRLGAASLALLIFAGVMTITELGNQGWGNQVGTILFAIFGWLSFAFVCVAGVFLTSDCLSEEKREGTLGLLFLTDLRGYDVVLGKLLFNSLAAVYGLLAAFPVIGLAFLLGGVTGAEFWRLMLVLLNTLFFSLAAGVLVSSLSRDSHKAMNATVLLCGCFILLLPAIDWAMAGWDSTKFEAWFGLASPGYTFSQADNARSGDFWTSLLIEHLLGWLFLAVASVLAPRTWKETSAAPATGLTSRAQRQRFGAPEKRRAFRLRWLEGNPVRWLAARDWWLGRFQWMVLIGAAGLVAVFGASVDQWGELLGIFQAVQGLLVVLLFLWVASYASRFFVEATRTGTLELLLATPVGADQIVRGQAWALRRTFLWPGLVLLLIAAVLNTWEIEQTLKAFAGATTAGTAPTLPPGLLVSQVISAIGGKVMFVTGLLAVTWFGMWMGLTSKKVNAAVIKTVVFVKVLPFLAMIFFNWTLMFVVFASGSGFLARTIKVPMWVPGLITFLLAIGGDVAFILVARRKLLKHFREIVARAAGVATALKPPLLPRSLVPAEAKT
jgi:ABC-type transport system involved in multi-copper enzyme maturation permease subunit